MSTKPLSPEYLAALPIAAFAVNAKGRITWWNDAMAHLTGRRADDVLSKRAWQAFFDTRIKTPVEFALRSEEEERAEAFTFMHHETGEEVVRNFVAVPVLDEEGEATGAMASLSTPEVQGASAADENLKHLPAPVMRIDRAFNVVYLNELGAQISGTTMESAVGRKCFDLFKTAHCNTPECRCLQAMERDATFTGRTTANLPSGAMPIEYTGQPIKDDAGQIVGALEYITDFSATKAAMDDALGQVDILNNVPTPILAIDTDYVVTYLNPAGAKVAGVTPEAAVGRKCYDLFRTTHCRTPECRCAQAMRDREPRSGETVVDPNGVNLPIEYTGAPLRDAEGEIIGALEYIVDITERKSVLGDIIEVAERMAARDLTAKATGDYKGDFLAIADSLNQALRAQHDSMVQVAESVEQISAASIQIAASSQSVAQGASEQASSLEETSSSLEEMSSMTTQTVDFTKKAQVLAEEAKSTADKGNEAMEKMSVAMTEIGDAAESTAEIINDINEIAFQTNLLALNAAVEAARAGEAGRGFAVVAEEVRNLAQRSKEAAKRTEALIKRSVKLSEGGQTLSGQVGEHLKSIVGSVSTVYDIVGAINKAAVEQARGIDQINTAVAQMDQVTQGAAANAEESSSAAEELSSQANELSSVVDAFTLDRRRQELAPVRRALPAPDRGRTTRMVAARSVLSAESDPDFLDF